MLNRTKNLFSNKTIEENGAKNLFKWNCIFSQQLLSNRGLCSVKKVAKKDHEPQSGLFVEMLIHSPIPFMKSFMGVYIEFIYFR